MQNQFVVCVMHMYIHTHTFGHLKKERLEGHKPKVNIGIWSDFNFFHIMFRIFKFSTMNMCYLHSLKNTFLKIKQGLYKALDIY